MGIEAFGMGGRSVAVPAFFPSVSSVKANSPPSACVRLLTAAGEPRFLVSAYDVGAADAAEQMAMKEALAAATARGVSVLLDSGNYESFWKMDRRWTADRLATVLGSTSPPLAFCYDNQEPDQDPKRAADEIVAAVARDRAGAPNTSICPIVHGTAERLVATVRSVGERLQPLLLAVAERELGDGILARAESVRKLRAVLDEIAPTTSLHVLGTGSPTALLVYAIAGAQSFDGLEWCHTCVDPDTTRLHHFQHRDLVRTLEPSIVLEMPYMEGTLVHNLLFFRGWLTRIREALASGTAEALLDSVLPATRRNQVVAALRRP